MTPDWMYALVALTAVIAAIVCAVAWKVAYGDGWEARGLHEQNLSSTGLLAARAQQRKNEFWGAPAGPDDFDRWLAQLREDDGERLASTGEMRMLKDYHPAGGRHAVHAAGTGTGAFRAITAAFETATDRYIEQIAADEEAYRRGLTS